MLRRPWKLLKYGFAFLLMSTAFIMAYHLWSTGDGSSDQTQMVENKLSGELGDEKRIPLVGQPVEEKIVDKRHVNTSVTKYVTIEKPDDGLGKHEVKPQIEEVDKNVVNYNVHAFYYAWYGNPGQDGQYYHWNHEYLPHWNAKISAQYPTGKKHVPPDDIGASFYPELGPYSSLDDSITRAHMIQMQNAGIGVLALSWYPPGDADDNGKPIEDYIPTLFNIADEYTIKVCFHIEPYKNRNAASIRENLKYIKERYGDHPAFYYMSTVHGKKVPLYYIYDSYLVDKFEWRKVLTKTSDLSIRDTELDAVMIGLLVEKGHMNDLVDAGFDGLYTYFAANGFTYGSTIHNWNVIARSAERNNMIFIPSVGPGYDDTRVRPWNKANSRDRKNGEYYDESWKSALSLSGVNTISITSFNEWHEGTQIEPASAQSNHGGFSYITYAPHNPQYYLDLTKIWSMKMLHANTQLS